VFKPIKTNTIFNFNTRIKSLSYDILVIFLKKITIFYFKRLEFSDETENIERFLFFNLNIVNFGIYELTFCLQH